MPATPIPNTVPAVIIKDLGLRDYQTTWEAMRTFTQQRNEQCADEIWYLQHHPVYTLGLNGKRHHLLADNGIPVINVDRGGQVTYHGPGQLVSYLLIDIARLNISVKQLVYLIEQSILDLLQYYDIHGERLTGAPGIYVDGAKIAALGLRIKHGKSYHGLALNVDMDLNPFTDIHPCGYAGMATTQLSDLLKQACPDLNTIQTQLHQHLCQYLGYPKL